MHWIYKIDPRRNTVVRQVYLGPTTALDFAADGGSVWVSGWGGVVKVSRSGRLLFQQRFDGVGWSLARTPGAVWVTQPFSGNRRGAPQRPLRRVLRVATSGPQKVTAIDLSVQPGDVSAAGWDRLGRPVRRRERWTRARRRNADAASLDRHRDRADSDAHRRLSRGCLGI